MNSDEVVNHFAVGYRPPGGFEAEFTDKLHPQRANPSG